MLDKKKISLYIYKCKAIFRTAEMSRRKTFPLKIRITNEMLPNVISTKMVSVNNKLN